MPKFSAYMRGEGVKGDTGKNATFGEVSATTHLSNFPSVTITTSGPEDQKDISFDFGLVSGPSGGFSTNQNANIQFTEVGSLPSVSITTDDTSPNNSKVFNFDFKIPEPKNIVNIEQTILSTTSEGENEITILYNDNSFTTFIVHNGAQGTPSFIQGAVSATSELPDNNNYTGQAFLVGNDEENKKLYVYLENEWKYQGTISGAGFGEPTGSIEIVSFTTSQIYMDDKIITLEKTEENNLEIESAKIYLQPQQDLHGYSAPWPAGGGKNLLKPPISDATINGVTFTVNSDGTITANGTASANADFYFVGANGVYEDAHIPSGTYIVSGNSSESSTSVFYIVKSNTNIIVQQFNGQSASVTLDSSETYRIFIRVQSDKTVTNQKYYPMIRSSSVTDAAYAPYSNECPISGHTSANIWDDPKYGGSITWKQLYSSGSTNWRQYSGTVSIADDGENGLSLTGETDAYSAAAYYYEGKLNIQNRVTYVTYKIRASVSGIVGINYGSYSYNDTIPTTWTQVDIMHNNVSWGSHYVGVKVSSGGTTGSVQIKDLMAFDLTNMFGETKANQIYAMEQQSAGAGIAYFRSLFPKDYYPYNITGDVTCISAVNGDPYHSITINLNGTYYGATVDALTGVMTVDRAIYTVDSASKLSYNVANTNRAYISQSTLGSKITGSNYITGTLSSKLRPALSGDYRYFFDNIGTVTLYLGSETYATKDDWFNAIGEFQLMYPIATTTVQLTPAELSLLLGENNIWTDAGVLELDCSEIGKPEIIVSVDPESPESAKIFNFDFKIPEGKPGEKGDTPIIGVSTSVTTLEHDVEPTVSITTLNENEFRFDFGIPVGYTPEMTATISTTDLPSGSTASATVNVEQNNLNFHFGIPQGLKGETGASINGFTFSTTNPETHGNIYYANFTDGTSTLFEVPEGPMGYGYYQKLEFTSTESSESYTWIEESNGSSTLIINRTENDFIPVNIYNSTSNNIAATFTLAASTENYPFGSIQYNTNEKFDGILYYIGKAPVPQLRIGSVTTSGDGIASVSTNKDGYDTVLNFSFPIKGDKGDKGETGNGIASVEILSVQGLTTNYRITFTDETMTPFDFSVRNGRNGSGGEGSGGIDEVDLSDDSIIINTLPIEHGGTGAATSTQAWTNLGGGDSGKHPENYYLKPTDVIIPTLDYSDSITSISTESYAGTTTYIARGDHVHSISLTTGDENGQVKIAGVNIDVKGLESAAYTVTTNYYPSTGGNIPTISIGGGERIDKISITNIDPGVGSELENNNILFVYTGGGGYSRCPDNSCYIITCPTDDCYNIRRYSESCPDDCYDSRCYKQCYASGNDITARTMYNYIPVRDAEGHFYRYLSMDEQVTISGEFTYPDGQIVENPVICFSYAVGHEADAYLYYKIGENQYIPAFSVDTVWTCVNNCFTSSCPQDNCYSPPCYGTCWLDVDCGINECYDTGCPADNCFIDHPCPGKVCDLSGCSRYVECYTGEYTCNTDHSCTGESFYCHGFKEMNENTCGDYCYEGGGESCGYFEW